uniref:Caveolin n=1 Tax=Hirondellea gigas TaxID=1518452 RepID=A0A6A7G7X6_9CRUS
MGSGPQFDMDNRDPNNLNPHLQIMWDDIVGEPEGLKTPDSCWNCSFKCYNGTRRCCYVLLVVIFGPCIAFISGINFACLSFNQVWCIGPCFRSYKINMATFRNFWLTFLMAVYSPMATVMGLLCSKVKVRYQKLHDGPDSEPVDYFSV